MVGPTPGSWTGKGWPGSQKRASWEEVMVPFGKSALRKDATGLISIQEENTPSSLGPKIGIIGENHMCNDIRNTRKGPNHKVTFIP